jgi:hypothetical protein
MGNLKDIFGIDEDNLKKQILGFVDDAAKGFLDDVKSKKDFVVPQDWFEVECITITVQLKPKKKESVKKSPTRKARKKNV